ncbi:chromate efflux transporter [Luteimonas viscosa]|uniref:Chromate efflux transporter n=1 Tax=Luteimonas viscosa TaxID=1132694 RepID=A0A5D4XM76_9GAMM|nr:chromate efflux transporter [Luteimonas viscosa]
MKHAAPLPRTATPPPGSAREVFRAFLRLGLTSFGGPIAHIGYLRHECVARRGWLGEARFAHLVAVCQFLPGPASSQLGFALGLQRAGWRGAFAAFVAFTLPSALCLFVLALLLPGLAGNAWMPAVVQGLKLLAVAVVAHGLAGMARRVVPDLPRIGIGIAAAALVLATAGAWPQLAAIVLGSGAGLVLCRGVASQDFEPLPLPHGRRTAAMLLAVWLALLLTALALPVTSAPDAGGVFAAFYRAGALVFGGGHVVLPLLQEAVVAPGWVDGDVFLAGYGAAQAVPGPMFTLAAFLGADIPLGMPAAAAAALALVAIFLPGLLLLAAVLPFWAALVRRPFAARAVAGINAAVVGLLAAAFYDPVWREGIRGPGDLLVAAVALGLLASGRVPVLAVVAWCVGASVALQAF